MSYVSYPDILNSLFCEVITTSVSADCTTTAHTQGGARYSVLNSALLTKGWSSYLDRSGSYQLAETHQ